MKETWVQLQGRGPCLPMPKQHHSPRKTQNHRGRNGKPGQNQGQNQAKPGKTRQTRGKTRETQGETGGRLVC